MLKTHRLKLVPIGKVIRLFRNMLKPALVATEPPSNRKTQANSGAVSSSVASPALDGPDR